MAVEPSISRAIIDHELRATMDLAESYGWRIVQPDQGLKFDVLMRAHNGDLFIVAFDCSDYRELPAIITFVDPNTGVEGTHNAFPKSHDSLFHSNGPCICAPFNRNAYKNIHKEWVLGDWTKSTANNYTWTNINTIADVLGLIQVRLSRPEFYKGRMP